LLEEGTKIEMGGDGIIVGQVRGEVEDNRSVRGRGNTKVLTRFGKMDAR